MWSSLPGLSRALSKQSGLFVAAITITSLLQTSWQSNCQTAKMSESFQTDQILRELRHTSIMSDLLICVTLFRSFCLEDLLRPSLLQHLQANAIHLIQEHRKEPCLCAVGCLTVWPRANQRINLIKEKDTRSAGPGLTKKLHVEKISGGVNKWNRQEDTNIAGVTTVYKVPVLKLSLSLRHTESRGQHHWQIGRHNEMSWLQPWQELSLHILEAHREAHHEAGADPDGQTLQGISSATRYSLMFRQKRGQMDGKKKHIKRYFSFFSK